MVGANAEVELRSFRIAGDDLMPAIDDSQFPAEFSCPLGQIFDLRQKLNDISLRSCQKHRGCFDLHFLPPRGRESPLTTLDSIKGPTVTRQQPPTSVFMATRSRVDE